MRYQYQIRLIPEEAANEQTIKRAVSHHASIPQKEINAVIILKRSIDARQRAVKIRM